MEKNTHPNRGWRKTWRIQPKAVEEVLGKPHMNWGVIIESYLDARGWSEEQLADALQESNQKIKLWITGSVLPPLYLMLALSALD